MRFPLPRLKWRGLSLRIRLHILFSGGVPLFYGMEDRYTDSLQPPAEDHMKKFVTLAIAVVGALAVLGASADAQTNPSRKKRTVIYNRDHTVQVSRDEDGRTRTRIIIPKRSYLDPGTETFPGERGDRSYAVLPNHRASGILDNTVFGTNQTALPGPWTLPSKNNPWLQY